MSVQERPVPTHVGVPEAILEFGAFSLDATQGLSLVGGGLLAYELWTDLEGAPLLVRQAAAAVCLVVGLVGALWRIDGHSLWIWLLVGVAYARFPRAAIWRLESPAAADRTPTAWVDITPPLVWPATPPSSHAEPRP
jgi:hypothetical protein